MEGWWAASYVVLWFLVIMLSVVVVALARQIGTLHMRLGPRGALEVDNEGPPLGEAPESFDVVAVDGEPVTVGGPGEAQLLMFVSPGCNVCAEVLPSMPVVAEAGELVPYVVSEADEEETRVRYQDERLRAKIVPGKEIVSSYEVPGTPYVVILDRLGVVRAKGIVNNLEQVEGLLDSARRRMTEAERQAS